MENNKIFQTMRPTIMPPVFQTTGPVEWIERNEILHQAYYNGWTISRYLEHKKWEPDKYFYIATKEGEKRITTHEWDTVSKAIHASTIATLF